jgi:hypothetical protein
MYDVYGTSPTASYPNSSWKQKNITHQNHRIRSIFRFDEKSKEFQAILRQQPDVKKLLEEESKGTSSKV